MWWSRGSPSSAACATDGSWRRCRRFCGTGCRGLELMGEMGESGERATCRRDGFGLARGGGGGLSLSEPLRKTISGSARFSLAIRVAPARRSDSAAARRSDSAAASSSRCSCCANARSASSCSRFRLASDASETRPGQRDAASRTQDGKSISSTSSSSVVEPSLMWSDTPLEESAVPGRQCRGVGGQQRTATKKST